MSDAPLLLLFDDTLARAWEPFSLTRPAGELLFGALTQRSRAEQALRLPFAGYLGCDELAGFEEPGAGEVLLRPPPRDRDRLFLCARAVPAWGTRVSFPDRPAGVELDGQLLGWYAPAGTPDPPPEFLREPGPATGPTDRLVLPGSSLPAIWDLIERNPAQLDEDFRALGTPDSEPPVKLSFAAIGSPRGRLRVGRNVTIEPGVVLDFSTGPIWLADDVSIRAFTRLAGPAYIGPGSTLFGGSLSGISIGPVCKVHGEMEGTIILGYSNKAHEGFLGHSYLGRWVNVGAQTTNSNLKNNYGPVRMWTPAGVADTGTMKLGCLLGDHVKTAIGTMIGTGTVVGAGSNLFGPDAPPPFVPPFTWGSGPTAVPHALDKFLETAAIAMSRRDVVLSDAMRDMLRVAWARGRAWAE